MSYIEKLEERYEKFGLKRAEIQKKIERLDGIEKEFMVYLYATMPLSDVANYEFEVFEDYVKHGAFLYETTELSKEMFMTYVLYHRVNDESIEPCRSFFHQQVLEEIGPVPYTVDGVLAVNYFCASHVTYRSTDDRTCAPKNVFLKGYGRCGEESVFACSVLRSLGIPSRQVYAQRWSHCDDNHAWVEVWVDGAWHFIGACEPEEVLDKGWFLNAASRAMYIRHITFEPQEDTENFVEKDGCTYVYNELERYAKTKNIEFIVKDTEGNFVDAQIHVGIMNYSEVSCVATLETINGKANFRTGYGSLMISVYKDNLIFEKCVNVAAVQSVEIDLYERTYRKEAFLFIAPTDAPIHSGYVTPEQKEAGKRKSYNAIVKRARRKRQANEIEDLQVSNTLLKKDLYDTDRSDLVDHEKVENSFGVSEEIFQKYVVCPRIYWENITAYKSFIQEFFDEKTKEKFMENPSYILLYIEENIRDYQEEEYGELYTTPRGVLEIGAGSKISCKILTVAILRSLGIPARINAFDLEVEYYFDDRFIPLEINRKCRVRLNLLDETKWEYHNNITISKLENGKQQLVFLQDNELQEDIYLSEGIYQIITTNRIPKGDIWVSSQKVLLDNVSQVEIGVKQRKMKITDMLSNCKIDDFEVLNEEGEKVWMSQIANKQLLFWLEPSKEPTEHILNELHELQHHFKEVPMVFLLPSKAAKDDKNIRNVLQTFSNITCVYDEASAETVARRMYVNPELLPLVVLLSDGLVGRFAVSGYNVGTAEMLVKLLSLL